MARVVAFSLRPSEHVVFGIMSTKRRGRYFSPAAGAAPGRRAGGPTVYCSDRKLLPRIKEVGGDS